MNYDDDDARKIEWQGTIVSIQPRTHVWRYKTDNRTHRCLGYNLFLKGVADGNECEFSVAISEKQQYTGDFHIDDVLSGTAWTKLYPKREYADYYRAGALKRLTEATYVYEPEPPPWVGTLPNLQTYEDRGARMLSAACWKGKCFRCIWATMSNVEIMYDFERRTIRRRFESFCYGPKSCELYKMGKARTVPYYDDYPSVDDGWLDDICTEGRDWDE